MKIMQPTPEQGQRWQRWRKWLADLPPAARAVAERFDPWTVYRMQSTGQYVTIHSFEEPAAGGDVILKVNALRKHNPSMVFERRVFVVSPDDLIVEEDATDDH